MIVKEKIFSLMPSYVVAGLAMFSMFFGSGNLVFPLTVGRDAGNLVGIASLGLSLTAILVPFTGLMGMILYGGDIHKFFSRIGRVPGLIVLLIIMSLLGPFAVIPRCVTVAYGAIHSFWGDVNLEAFVLISCAIVFLFTWRRENIFILLGYFLTPLLLSSLVIIIGVGILQAPPAPVLGRLPSEVFTESLITGYGTMDLLASFFFSALVVKNLRSKLPESHKPKELMVLSAKAGVIGATLLACIYLGFVYIAGHFSLLLNDLQPHELLPKIAKETLGHNSSVIVSTTVALACLSTAATLIIIFVDFIRLDMPKCSKLPYIPLLLISLGITYFLAVKDFSGIATYLIPLLSICYPGLIVLCICNILHKTHHFKWVKWPVYITFGFSLIQFALA